MGETLCKISFFGHNILLRKNKVSKLKAFEMICKYYLFFRNFDIDFFAPMVYNKTNGGQSSARNLGLQNARGEYVLFLSLIHI